MKKLLTTVLILALMLTATANVFANPTPVESKVGFVLDGQIQNWDEANLGKIFLSQGRSFVPLRVISEKLGYKVTWEQKTSSAIIEKDDTKISFRIGASEVSTPTGVVTLDVASFVMNGRTYVPMRGLFEALNAEIDWVSAKNVANMLGVNITSLNKDFYVVVKSGNTSGNTSTVGGVQNYLKSGSLDLNVEFWEDVVSKTVPSDVYYDIYPSGVTVGAENWGNEAVRFGTYTDNRFHITISKWQYQYTKDTVKATLNVVAGSDADEIYNNIANRVWIGEWTKAKNGTEYKFENYFSYGTTIFIKMK